MAWLAEVLSHKDSLLRGATLLAGGAALVLAGSMVSGMEGNLGAIFAGTLATTGIVLMFLGFFVHVLPPLLPAR